MNSVDYNKSVKRVLNCCVKFNLLYRTVDLYNEFEKWLDNVKTLFTAFEQSANNNNTYNYHTYFSDIDFFDFSNNAIIQYVANNICYSLHNELSYIFQHDLYGCSVHTLVDFKKELHNKNIFISLKILNAYRVYNKKYKQLNSPLNTHHPEDRFDRPVMKFDQNFNMVHGDHFNKWVYKDDMATFLKNVAK